MNRNSIKTNEVFSYLGQCRQALLLDLPQNLVLLELETLFNVQLRNPDPDENEVGFPGTDGLVVHPGADVIKLFSPLRHWRRAEIS